MIRKYDLINRYGFKVKQIEVLSVMLGTATFNDGSEMSSIEFVKLCEVGTLRYVKE